MFRPTLVLLALLSLTACNDSNVPFDVSSSNDGPQSPINPGDGGVFDPATPGSEADDGDAAGGGSGGGDIGGGVAGGGGSSGGDGSGGSSGGGSAGNADGSGSGTPPGAPVPEPATMLLLGTGAVGLGAYRRRKAANQVEEAPAE